MTVMRLRPNPSQVQATVFGPIGGLCRDPLSLVSLSDPQEIASVGSDRESQRLLAQGPRYYRSATAPTGIH